MSKAYIASIHTSNQLATFTPALGEVCFDSDKKTLVVGDGVTKGGRPLPQSTNTLTLIDVDVLDGADADGQTAGKAVILNTTGQLEVDQSITPGANVGAIVKQSNEAGGTYTGTNTGLTVKNYDADNTVDHSGGETGGLSVWLKTLSEPADGGEYVLITGHAHGSNTGTIKHGVIVYGDLTNAFSASGGASVNGINFENQTISGGEIKFSTTTELLAGVATTATALRADGGDDSATGSIYTSTNGDIWRKLADNKADLDWKKIGDAPTITTVATATYDLLATDDILHVTYTSTAAVTSLTIPSAQIAIPGPIAIVKDAGGLAGANNITIDTEGAETIDGEATSVISTNYASVSLYSDGTNLFIY